MGVRTNIYSATPEQLAAFVAALQALKSSGVYDSFTERHMLAMATTVLMPGETTADTARSANHRGPSFFPWHRQFLLEFEAALQAVDPTVSLVYWKWDAEPTSWQTTAPLWAIVGGNGDPAQGNLVTTGPFAGWTSRTYRARRGDFRSRAGIQRRFATRPLPTAARVAQALAETTYDVADWDEWTTTGFRNVAELNLHNVLHARIGGDMSAGTSPNDPIFWLHHAYLDLLWMRWQLESGHELDFLPIADGPPGHNRDEPMTHLLTAATPASTLDCTLLPYTYDIFVP